MTLLVIVDPQIPVPPTHYGGVERIVHLHCEGLTARGHTVRLLAGPGSRNYGGGLWVHRAPGRKKFSRAWRKLWFQCLSRWAARGRVDAVVNFGRTDYLLALLRRADLPLVCWFQNPVEQPEIDWLGARRRRGLRFVGISQSQVAGLEAHGLMRVIYNAVDTAFLGFSASPAQPPYVAFLGRLTRNKGVHLAMEAARQAGVALKIGGTIARGETGGEEYFEREVRPRLGPGCEWIGPVDDAQKRTLLQGAAALLFPIQWNEPFGIVMAESLACGTPVIAWHLASTPEVVRDGETGYLCRSVEEMAAAIGQVRAGEIRREACREAAEKCFSNKALLAGFLELLGELNETPASDVPK